MINLSLVIEKAENKTVFVELQVQDIDHIEIDIFDDVYFSAPASSTLQLFTKPELDYEIIGDDKEIKLLTKGDQRFTTNTDACFLHKGCEIEVKTSEKC